MSIQQSEKLTREEIAMIFSRHPGSQARIAERLNVRNNAVSQWLADKMGSERIEKACRAYALKLLHKEQQSDSEKTAHVA